MGISKTNLLAIPFLLHCLMILAYLIFKSIESNYESTFDKLMLAGIFISFVSFVWFAIREVIQSDEFNANEKILWILLLVFFGYIGAGLYWYIGRKKMQGRFR
jgi:hypothetical protein